MFGIGMSEMIIILAVALLVFGPDKLPEIAKSISRGLKDLRRASDDLRHSVNMHIDDDEPRVRPRVKPTAGIPDAPRAADATANAEPGPNIPGSELAKDLDPLPANAPPPAADPLDAPVVARAADGAVARGSAAPAETADAAPQATTDGPVRGS